MTGSVCGFAVCLQIVERGCVLVVLLFFMYDKFKMRFLVSTVPQFWPTPGGARRRGVSGQWSFDRAFSSS